MDNGRDNDLDRSRTDMYRTQDLYKDTQTDIYSGYDTAYDTMSWQTDDEKAKAQSAEPESRPHRQKRGRNAEKSIIS